MTNEPEPNTRAGEAQAHQLATALMGVERFTADGNFHPDYLAMLTRPLPQPSELEADARTALIATAEAAATHLKRALAAEAQIAKLQARLEVVPGWSEDADGIACRNDTIKLVAEVKRLTALADDHFRNARRLSEVVVARDAQIAKLQADGDKLAGALERSRQGWSNVLELGLLPVQHQSTALGLQEAANQALAAKGDSRG